MGDWELVEKEGSERERKRGRGREAV